MVDYSRLTTSELDGLLTLGYLPERKGKVSFSDRELFHGFIITKIQALDLGEELGRNIIYFIDRQNELSKPVLCYHVILADMHILKLAALKTYHDYKEIMGL